MRGHRVNPLPAPVPHTRGALVGCDRGRLTLRAGANWDCRDHVRRGGVAFLIVLPANKTRELDEPSVSYILILLGAWLVSGSRGL